MTKKDILKIFERYENVYGDGIQKRRWDEIADEILAKIFLQPDVSGNEAIQSENKKDGEVAVCCSGHGTKTIIDLAGYRRCVYCGKKY